MQRFVSRINHREKNHGRLHTCNLRHFICCHSGDLIEYYRQIRKAQKEYEKARDFVEDIVLSFDRELKRESEDLNQWRLKSKETMLKQTQTKKIDNVEKKIAPFEEQLGALKQTISQTLIQNNTTISIWVDWFRSKNQRHRSYPGNFKGKIIGFEEQIQKILLRSPEIRSETVIFDQAGQSLSRINRYRNSRSRNVAKEGAKTAPEIKERVSLSREHTARLMKKLYEEGYLEREVGKIPFRYSIKKEMENLMQKVESKST